jgi:hypothetical protein
MDVNATSVSPTPWLQAFRLHPSMYTTDTSPTPPLPRKFALRRAAELHDDSCEGLIGCSGCCQAMSSLQ